MTFISSTHPSTPSANSKVKNQRIENHQWAPADTQVRRHLRTGLSRSLMLGAATLLTACGLGGPFPGVPDLHSPESVPPYKGETAAPQVAYRIDENRYFEIVPYGPGACTNAMVHFVDKAKGIRSEAVRFDWGPMVEAALIIDASNDQYLVAPATRGNTDCSSGGGLCGGSKLPYSTDGGRTWKRGEVSSASDDISVSGSAAYAIGNVARKVDLALGISSLKDWKSVPGYQPDPRVPPLDTKFHCNRNGKE